MKVIVTRKSSGPGDDKKPTQQDIDAANKFAKDFATRKQLLIGEDAHVGNAIPKFIDSSTGKDITGVPATSKLPYNTILDIRKVPAYVMPEDIKMDEYSNVPYYIDPHTGDAQPIHPDIARSSRFNPKRGMAGLSSSPDSNGLIATK